MLTFPSMNDKKITPSSAALAAGRSLSPSNASNASHSGTSGAVSLARSSNNSAFGGGVSREHTVINFTKPGGSISSNSNNNNNNNNNNNISPTSSPARRNINNLVASSSSFNPDGNYQMLKQHYEFRFNQLKRQQHEARAQSYFEAEQKVSEERRKLHDDPANLWGGDVGLALAKLVAYAQSRGDNMMQDMLVQLELEMHSQMMSVQKGLDEMKQRFDVVQREIAEERELIAGHRQGVQGEGAAELLMGMTGAAAAHKKKQMTGHSLKGALPANNNSNHVENPSSNKRVRSLPSCGRDDDDNNDEGDDSDDDDDDDDDAGFGEHGNHSKKSKMKKKKKKKDSRYHRDGKQYEFPLTRVPVPATTTRLHNSLHSFPVLIAEALWRELKCETVNIYLRGRDKLSNLCYSVPARTKETTSFVRLHRAVESAVFTHQVAVCAWDAAAGNIMSASMSGGNAAAAAGSGADKSMNRGDPTVPESSLIGQLFQPVSYVVWPVVLAGSASEQQPPNDAQHQQTTTTTATTTTRSTTVPSSSAAANGGGRAKTAGKVGTARFGDDAPMKRRTQQQQRSFGEATATASESSFGAHYYSVAAIECINKRTPAFATGGATGTNDFCEVGGGGNYQNNNSSSTMMSASMSGSSSSQMKNQFTKTDEALIASAARLLAACFEGFPEALVPHDAHSSHVLMQQQAAAVAANARPLPGETPSVAIPTAIAAAESACLAVAPVKIFRGPCAAIFKATLGMSLSNPKHVPSTSHGLAQLRSAAVASSGGLGGIDSFTHDGNLRSLEASISYLDSMWKAAFADNVGMHEECRKQQTKIRDLSFICSQVEECFAAARKLNTIEETRAFLRTTELSLKSGSRALLGSAMKLALDSELDAMDREENSSSSAARKRKNHPPASSAAGGAGAAAAAMTGSSRRSNNTSDGNSSGLKRREPLPPPSPSSSTQLSSRQQHQQQQQAAADRFKMKDGIAISEIHIDGPEGLRHYSVDAATKKAQMTAIAESIKLAAADAAVEKARHYRPLQRRNPSPPRSSALSTASAAGGGPTPSSLSPGGTAGLPSASSVPALGGARWLRHHK